MGRMPERTRSANMDFKVQKQVREQTENEATSRPEDVIRIPRSFRRSNQIPEGKPAETQAEQNRRANSCNRLRRGQRQQQVEINQHR